MNTSIDLDELREQSTHVTSKQPFQHQIEAFEALNKTFLASNEKPGSGILVLPTGAGKTFTAVRWLSDHVIPKNIKILWLAPSFYLLDQAFSAFYENAKEIQETKKYLNIRRVSSNPSHAKASSVQLTDDVIIMTIQTAISNLHTDAVDRFGEPVDTALKKYTDDNKESDFFVVVDEAHHSPAYGCRNLLISDDDSKPGIRKLLPKSSFLGLTATPTYTDKSRRGWLWKIFDDGIVYEAEKASLISQKVLAKPNYIEMATGKELEVDDKLYERLVRQHKDLPESVIEILANDRERNNLIVNTYAENKSTFGKAIIFADRWFQCVYLKEKLQEKGIHADAIYSKIDADPGSAEARNKRTQSDNKKILEQFKTGKDAHGNDSPLDVLINVRMLTEGADVPDVETVFLARQTTSSILITQMIGRALRGEKAGGSSEANIVLFFDDWKRLIDWANPFNGETNDNQSSVKGHYPLEYISIRLVEEVSKSIESGGDYSIPEYSKIVPIGWYKTEIVYADPDFQQDSMEGFTEFVMVYEHTKKKFDRFIDFIMSANLSDEWSKEYLDEDWIYSQTEQWVEKYFELATDDIGNRLYSDVTKIVRHISQNQSIPPYHSFEERELYDLDNLAQEVIHLPPHYLREQLAQEFSQSGTLWKTFYKKFSRFETAVQTATRNILDREMYGSNRPIQPPSIDDWHRARVELTQEEKEQVKQRDGYACLCCGIHKGRGVRLEIDHIVPLKFGGETTLDNSQTLCSLCNGNYYKGINELNFRFNTSLLKRPKVLDITRFENLLLKDRDTERSITRIVNFFYHCKAVHKIDWHKRRNGKNYHVWEIHLYAGNNPEWLLKYKGDLLSFVQNRLGYSHVQDIRVSVPD